jgi:predicted dehydrogenase
MAGRIRWAILGTGAVANRFAGALHNISDQAELLAVGSRRQESADAFGSRYAIPRRYGSYAEVAADPDVDVVYIGTPHLYHLRDASLCLEGGRHVLCEKAFTMNVQEAAALIDLARARGLFLMEAMWTRFFPVHVRLRELVAQGVFGELRGLIVHHVYQAASADEVVDPRLGLGAFMDQAPYGVGLAASLLGPVEDVAIQTATGPTGVSEQAFYVLKHAGGRLSSIVTSRVAVDVKDAFLFGSLGKVEIHDPWYKPTRMTVEIRGKPPETIEFPLGGYTGYEYEALAVMDCIRAGRTECDAMPLSDTLAVMRVMDRLRGAAGWNV